MPIAAVAGVLAMKGSAVHTVDPDTSVTELLTVLAAHGVGAVVVVEAPGLRPVGMVSERDVVRGLHTRGAELLTEPVSSIMSRRLTTCRPADRVDALSVTMTERRIRHVPVVDDHGALAGLVSIGDVVKNHIDQLEEHRGALEAYING
jgi:CBS domain-containing protein